MPALNFKKQFRPMIKNGWKVFTLRNYRKDGRDPVTGETLFLFTGMRTKACRKFATKPCLFHCTAILGHDFVIVPALFGWDKLSGGQLDRFVTMDGFPTQEAFFKFHNVGLDENRPMQLVAWIKREELIKRINH